MIIRVVHDDHFTVVRNKTLRDSRLSFKARGLLGYLLSLPDDTQVNREILAAQGPDGETAIRSGLRELVTAGYIDHELFQDELGKWRTDTTVRECPRAGEPSTKPSTTGGGLSTTGNARSGGGKPTTKGRSTKEGKTAHASPPFPPPEETEICAICGQATRYMREDGEWRCPTHEESPHLRVLDGA